MFLNILYVIPIISYCYLSFMQPAFCCFLGGKISKYQLCQVAEYTNKTSSSNRKNGTVLFPNLLSFLQFRSAFSLDVAWINFYVRENVITEVHEKLTLYREQASQSEVNSNSQRSLSMMAHVMGFKFNVGRCKMKIEM